MGFDEFGKQTLKQHSLADPLAHSHSLSQSHPLADSLAHSLWQGCTLDWSGGWSARLWYGSSGVELSLRRPRGQENCARTHTHPRSHTQHTNTNTHVLKSLVFFVVILTILGTRQNIDMWGYPVLSSYMYISTYVDMYICIYVHMHICTYVYMYICKYVHMYMYL